MAQRRRLMTIAALAVTASMASSVASAAVTHTIERPDPQGGVGQGTSLALDAAGFPVISYVGPGSVKVLHCNDPHCAGGDETIATFATSGLAGSTSLALDGAGHPVVGFWDSAGTRVLRCNDPTCTGGGDTITTPDPSGGGSGSLALDALDNPVVAYGWPTVRILHCNDARCDGGDDTITNVVTNRGVVSSTSLRLNAAGNPVVALSDGPRYTLWILACNDPHCAGGDDSLTRPDVLNDMGFDPSLAIDAMGNPIVSYYLFGDYSGEGNHWSLAVMHCNDHLCAGRDESVVVVDSFGDAGHDSSLVIDRDGNPAIGYHAWKPFDGSDDNTPGVASFRVLRCSDPNCSGPRTIGIPDASRFDSWDGSLVVDDRGNPVASYHDGTDATLEVLRCGDPSCVTASGAAALLRHEAEHAELNEAQWKLGRFLDRIDREVAASNEARACDAVAAYQAEIVRLAGVRPEVGPLPPHVAAPLTELASSLAGILTCAASEPPLPNSGS